MITEERIQQILLDIEHLKMQSNRLVSDAESEKGQRRERNKQIDESIKKLESDFKDILFGKDRVSGLLISVDRLNQIKKLVWGMIVLIVPLVVKAIMDWLK